MKKFWQWVRNEVDGIPCRELALEGYIAEESWFDDDVTPKQFKADLYGGLEIPDDIVVRISSPGGDCFAAAKIYDMLMEYPGKVSMHIDGLAASAASVIAMASHFYTHRENGNGDAYDAMLRAFHSLLWPYRDPDRLI